MLGSLLFTAISCTRNPMGDVLSGVVLSLPPRQQLGKDPGSQALAPGRQVTRILLDDPAHHFVGSDRQKHARFDGDVDSIRTKSFDHQRSPVEKKVRSRPPAPSATRHNSAGPARPEPARYYPRLMIRVSS